MAATIALVLVVGVLTAVRLGASAARDQHVLAAAAGLTGVGDDGATTTTASPPTSTASPASPGTTTTGRASTTSTSRPAGASTTVTTRKAGGSPTTTTVPSRPAPVVRSTRAGMDGGHPDPNAVEIPFSAGRTLWTGTSYGVVITVRTDKAFPQVGDAVTFDFEFSSPVHDCCGLWFVPGTGRTYAEQNGWTCPDGGPHGPGPVHFRETIVYNLGGLWTFMVNPIIGGCGERNAPAALFGTIEVAPGLSVAQGPAQPTVTLGNAPLPPAHANDPRWLALGGQVEDSDGYISSVQVDWGDGSDVVTLPQVDLPWGCTAAPSGWPVGTWRSLVPPDAVHQYPAPGVYTVTVTGTSTACDGSMPQHGSGALVWSVPG